jgi:predicted DNA-binding ribbon-helix-helix protein
LILKVAEIKNFARIADMASLALPTPSRGLAGRGDPRTTLVNRNVRIAGRRTSIRLEPAMWNALQEICLREHASMHEIVTRVAGTRSESSMTAAIRVYLLNYFQAAATDDGHRNAGHGAVARRFNNEGGVHLYGVGSGAPL